MLWVDNAIVILVGLFMLSGLFRGYNQESFSVAVWLIAIPVAWFFSENFSLFFIKILPSSSDRLAASFASLIGLTIILGWIINLLLGESIKRTGLSFLDRLGGLLLGSVHGSLLVLAFVLISGFTALPKDSWWRQSFYIPFFQTLAEKIKHAGFSSVSAFIDDSPHKVQVK